MVNKTAVTISKAELTCPLCNSWWAVIGADTVWFACDITDDMLLTGVLARTSSLLAICSLIELLYCLNPRHNSSWMSRGTQPTNDSSKLSITMKSLFHSSAQSSLSKKNAEKLTPKHCSNEPTTITSQSVSQSEFFIEWPKQQSYLDVRYN